jgi:RNA-directed DNA polymerase
MDRLRVRIKDKRILALVKAFLKAGIMTPDGEEESHSGTPQGVVSPLLANIALSALDDHFAGQWQQLMKTSWQRRARRERGLGNRKMIRFADDFVVMVAGERRHAEALRGEVSGVLATLGLRLAAEKTRVVHIDEGFDFLSITIRRMRKRGTSKHYVYTKPSKKAIQAVKDKVSAKTYRSTLHQEPAVLIQGISQALRGWAGYHRHGVSKAVFSAVDSHAWNRITRWLRRKYQGRTGLGMPELRRRFCVPGTWKLAHNGVVFTGAATVPVTRYRYRGTRIPCPYPEPSAGPSG